MPMFKRNLAILSLYTFSLPSIMLVIFELVLYITLFSGLIQNIYDCVSCRWWRIHHGLPSMGLFLSTSNPYPGIRIRNQDKYLGPACLNGRLPCFQHDFTSLTLDWNILQSVRLQFLYSHSMKCTNIPWESLTLMVISLTLVNSFHQWLVIKWFLPCSTSSHLFLYLESYQLGLEWRP